MRRQARSGPRAELSNYNPNAVFTKCWTLPLFPPSRGGGSTISVFVVEDAVVADAKAEEAFELAGQGLDAAHTGVGVAADGFENRHGNVTRDELGFSAWTSTLC